MKLQKKWSVRISLLATACLLLAVNLILTQCQQKDKIFRERSFDDIPAATKDRNGDYTRCQVVNDILVFDDRDAFLSIYADLQEASTWAEDPYEEQDDDQVIEPFVDDDPVLAEFEESKGLQSLRKKYLMIEYEALNAGDDPSTIPDYGLDDDVLMAFLNEKAIMQIGETLYWVTPGGVVYLIPHHYLDIIEKIQESGDPFSFDGVTTMDTPTGTQGACSSDFYALGYTSALSGTFHYNGIPNNPATGVKFKWNFGDGTTSTEKDPAHTFPYAGTFRVCLVITVGDTCSSTECKDIKVGATCRANFNYDKNGVNCQVQFEDLSSTSSGNITTWHWDFPGGSPSSFDGRVPPPITYTCNGDKYATLKVTSNSGCEDTYSTTFKVTSCECCKVRQKIKEADEVFNGGNNKIKWVQKQQYFPFKMVKGKMKHFKKKKNGGWKKTKADLAIDLTGHVYYEGEGGCTCEIPDDISKSGSKHARKLKVYKRIYEQYDGKYSDQWLADFKVNGALIKQHAMPTACD